MLIGHPAQIWNNMMRRLGGQASRRNIKESAKAAEWLQRKIGGHAEWSPSRAIAGGKVYYPFTSSGDFRILMDKLNRKDYGPATKLTESVLSKYSPAMVTYGKTMIGGGFAPGSSTVLHELGHQFKRGTKWVQPVSVSGQAMSPIRYGSRLASILPSGSRVPGLGLLKYVERAPLLLEELRASRNAMHALRKTNASPRTIAANRRALASAYGTYLNPFQ